MASFALLRRGAAATMRHNLAVNQTPAAAVISAPSNPLLQQQHSTVQHLHQAHWGFRSQIGDDLAIAQEVDAWIGDCPDALDVEGLDCASSPKAFKYWKRKAKVRLPKMYRNHKWRVVYGR